MIPLIIPLMCAAFAAYPFLFRRLSMIILQTTDTGQFTCTIDIPLVLRAYPAHGPPIPPHVIATGPTPVVAIQQALIALAETILRIKGERTPTEVDLAAQIVHLQNELTKARSDHEYEAKSHAQTLNAKDGLRTFVAQFARGKYRGRMKEAIARAEELTR